MKIVQRLQSAWQNDSFYMQTTSRNAASIFKAGAVGVLAGRITKVISPRDGAIRSIANKVSDTFVNFMENRFAKEPFMSDEDKDLEKDLRLLVKIGLNYRLSTTICSLARMRGFEKMKGLRVFGFNIAVIQFLGVSFAINIAIEMAFKALFPSPEPRGAS